MKLGMIAYPNEDGFNHLKSLGLEALEITCNSPEDTNDRISMTQRIKKSVSDTGVSVTSIGRWGQEKVTESGEVLREAIEENKRLIDFAAEIGAPVFNMGVNYANKLTKLQNIEISAAILRELTEYATSRGVKPAVYNCSWSNYIHSPELWDIFLAEFPALGIKFDPSHTFERGAKYLEETLSYGNRFYHTHVKGVIHDSKGHYDNPPAGLDIINWNAYFGALYYSGYTGVLSIEPHSSVWHGELGDAGVRYTIKYVRQFML